MEEASNLRPLYPSEFVPVSCNYPLSHQYGTSVVEAQTSEAASLARQPLPRNVPSGEIEAPRNGCIRRLPPWRVVQYSQIDSIGVSVDKKAVHWYQW